jgi:hypothetical protein
LPIDPTIPFAPSGFGWKEGDIINAVIVTVPSQGFRNEQAAAVFKLFAMFSGVAVLLSALLFIMFELIVRRRRPCRPASRAFRLDPDGCANA